ncbi:MarR family winged helix-turn-helix transcriptional regulator [Umezawaea tangerina]|uniref:DNA-binding MarR family transcriptional regulator n=1 Tax=Umezawaea tangerina TaxID=84725 RepID=A0A2T0SS36_9PSEU|nr:MarR family transcriptional regulator [Umezawaea tangerina]PRY36227.1 DNA-binding MarR family transcriptional regulator [Umezawaea tangerina]
MTPRNVDLLMLLQLTSHALETEMAARLAAIGVSPRAHCVLTNAAAGERTQSELAELSNLDKTTMVVTMDALEKAGLAERRLSSTDRRARIIVVTDEGREIVGKAHQVVQELYEDVLGTLPDEQSEALVDGLSGLLAGRLAEKVPCDSPPRRRAVRSVVKK